MDLNLNNFVMLATAFFNAVTMAFAYRAQQAATKAAAATVATQMTAAETKVIAVETKAIAEETRHNTNSLTAQLVASSTEAAHSAGKEEGRLAGEVKAAALAEGKLSATTKPKG